MELSALLLSRLQFAFTISFHIIFPSFSTPVDRDSDRMVHGRGRASAVDGLRSSADGRRDDAVPHCPASGFVDRRQPTATSFVIWLPAVAFYLEFDNLD